jgi:beta-N-acetylhexosaminidase
MKPVIFGLSGPELGADEARLFSAVNPAGFILFARNIDHPEQVRALTAALRSCTGRDDTPILVDQEGGRVVRLRPPHWPDYPSGARFDALYDVAPATAMAAARANATAIALALSDVGISMNCAPILDVRRPGASDVIGDRALGAEPLRVAALGRAIMSGLRDGGVVAAIKHMPGHGRAMVDSHHELPIVDADDAALASDLAPFVALADAPAGLTAHLCYTHWDSANPATLSARIIADVIRGHIGFGGLLLSDDITMQALAGAEEARVGAALTAGVDVVLHCSGDFAAMERVAAHCPPITPDAAARLTRAMQWAKPAEQGQNERVAELLAQRDSLLAMA